MFMHECMHVDGWENEYVCIQYVCERVYACKWMLLCTLWNVSVPVRGLNTQHSSWPFVQIHKKVRHNAEMAHHSLMCISQLASLNGLIFTDDKARLCYLNMFVEGLLQLLTK